MTYDEYQNDMSDLMRRFSIDMDALTERYVKSGPDGEKAFELACALCSHQWPYTGGDTDAHRRLTVGMAHAQIMQDIKGTAAFVAPIYPAWWHFLGEAYVALKFIGNDVTKEKAVDFMAAVREIAKP